MSHDTKTGCADRQGHAEISVVPFALRTDAKRDRTLNEPERSFPPTSSLVAATCASDTDDGDYETSSEGMIRSKRSGSGEICRRQAKKSLSVCLKEKSASLSKRATFDGNISAIKRGVPFDSLRELMENGLTQKIRNAHDSLTLMSENLAQSKSLPILKSDLPKDVSSDFTAADVALMSASSFARKRKMSMIVKKMVPLISPYPSTASLTTGATANFRNQRHEGRRLTSGTKLSMLSDATPMTVINDARSEELVAEVTLHETKNNRRTMNWDPARDAISTFVNDEGAANLTNDGDLVDLARNPYSSIKSVYFSPNLLDPSVLPDNFGKPRGHQRMSTDVETLRKIDDELAPLRCQYSEIIGKTRALSLSGTGLDLGIHYHLDWSNTLGQYTLSSDVSNYFPDRSQTHLLRRVTTSCSIETRPVLVDKTTPSTISSFSMVGKPTQRDSHTSWLNDPTRRQEALSLAIRDSPRALEGFQVDGLRPSSRVGNNISHVPASDSHAFQGENVLGDRSCNRCFSNSNFQPYRKSEAVIERATSTWNGLWFVRGTIDASPSNVLGRTEYNSHRYLNRTVRDSRTSTNDFIEVRRQKSSVSIVEVIDNNCPIADADGAANKRSKERNEIPSSDQNSTMVEMEFTAGRGGDNCHKSILPETERLVKDEQISSPFALKSIERDDAGPECRVLRAASACPPQIRVVSVNTEFRTTVEKRYTSRAVSPIQHSHSATASSTTAPRNNLLAGTLMQQVHADSSKEEVTKIRSSTEMRSIDPRKKRDALANAASRCDFCVGKVDPRSAAETLSRLPESGKDNTDLTTTGLREARYLRLPRTKEKITIVPIVLTDRDSPRSANVDFAIPTYADEAVPKLSYQIAPFDARKFRETSPPFIRANESSRRGIREDPMCLAEEFAGEKRWRTSGISVSHVNRNLRAGDDYSPATTSSVTKNPKRLARVATPNARKWREYRESASQRVAKMIPGMRSTPEDFLCET